MRSNKYVCDGKRAEFIAKAEGPTQPSPQDNFTLERRVPRSGFFFHQPRTGKEPADTGTRRGTLASDFASRHLTAKRASTGSATTIGILEAEEHWQRDHNRYFGKCVVPGTRLGLRRGFPTKINCLQASQDKVPPEVTSMSSHGVTLLAAEPSASTPGSILVSNMQRMPSTQTQVAEKGLCGGQSLCHKPTSNTLASIQLPAPQGSHGKGQAPSAKQHTLLQRWLRVSSPKGMLLCFSLEMGFPANCLKLALCKQQCRLLSASATFRAGLEVTGLGAPQGDVRGTGGPAWLRQHPLKLSLDNAAPISTPHKGPLKRSLANATPISTPHKEAPSPAPKFVLYRQRAPHTAIIIFEEKGLVLFGRCPEASTHVAICAWAPCHGHHEEQRG
ncbi:hypothetical protein Anapl_12713 [Anas platyrhynchos]|uniref:Uncharacterized protein n=1 Tax=Anas platyrhynchos TaxID=8839 RepID=R0L4Y8_ANAPL|nr:hypothetical protein Anapl_12713 [Anas platyrhynchos]